MIKYVCTRSNYEINVVSITNTDERRYKFALSKKGLGGCFWIMVIDQKWVTPEAG
jgi:hypothetical protein